MIMTWMILKQNFSSIFDHQQNIIAIFYFGQIFQKFLKIILRNLEIVFENGNKYL